LAEGAAWLALSIACTWPLGNIAHPVLPRHDDPLFSTWRIAWIAHQVLANPTQLFDANIFSPETNTLAYSDAMLLLGLIATPFIWLGIPAAVVHNGLVIGSFVTAAMSMTRLMRFFSADRTAHVVAALIFAFAPYRVAHIIHLELLWTAFIPLAVLALYRVLQNPSARRGIAFGASVALQALCSLYYGVFLSMWLVGVLALAPLHMKIQWSRGHIFALTAGVAAAVAIAAPYVGPYGRAHSYLGPRSEDDLHQFSASWSDYLHPHTANRVYGTQRRDNDQERSLYVGAVAMALGAISILFVRSRTVFVYAALTFLAIDLSLGINGVAFNLARRVVPVLDAFRSPSRFAVLALLGTAVVAGLGAAWVVSWSMRRRRLVAALLCVAVAAEYWAAPISTYEAPLWPGQFDRWLAQQPRTVIAALPLPPRDQMWGYETVFQYLSIFHWQPMVNGYSGHAPRNYLRLLKATEDYPSERAIRALVDRGAELVVFYESYTDEGQFDRLLYACQNAAWFSEVVVMQERSRGRSAACRLVR
jgi:hypothetical protein